MQVAFADLPLHDAVLDRIEMSWREGWFRFHLHCFVRRGEAAQPRVLEFQEVVSACLPHAAPWGPSNSVLSAAWDGDFYRLNMQSGDEISIRARSFALLAVHVGD